MRVQILSLLTHNVHGRRFKDCMLNVLVKSFQRHIIHCMLNVLVKSFQRPITLKVWMYYIDTYYNAKCWFNVLSSASFVLFVTLNILKKGPMRTMNILT